MTTLYLCGPINGRSDAEVLRWREFVKRIWIGRCIDPMRRDYRGKEQEPGVAADIVLSDIEDIKNCDVVLAYFDRPSVGTSMEIFYAKSVLKKPVIVVDASDKPLSPWLTYHADYITRHVSVALAYIHMNHRAT